ncbi:hypothetical protein BGV51_09075 [Burkholderia ubonensis]|nr:hypothetical protein WM01_05105 [Burkholderia ubonensis]OJB00817.1 hypothetical protein BGV51_09075 [Burkholderia ubonensis]
MIRTQLVFEFRDSKSGFGVKHSLKLFDIFAVRVAQDLHGVFSQFGFVCLQSTCDRAIPTRQ